MIDISQKQLDTVVHILTEFVPDCEVRAFGSRVNGEIKTYSDLDIAVISAQQIDNDIMRRLREAFQESDLPFRVDVLDWNAISDSFKRVIEKRNIVLQRYKDLIPDINQIIASRLAFFEKLPVPASSDPLIRRTFAKCASVQKNNCCTAQGDIPFNWATPDRWPHKYMWIWDSAFHALGLRHFAPEWAMDSLKAVVSKVHEDGFLPHMMTPDDSKDSTIIQPPILAWAVWKVYEKTKDVSFLRNVYDGIRDMLLYDMSVMDKDHDGLSEWGDSCASGMDNSPRFEQPVGAAVDLNSFIANDFRYLSLIAHILGKSDDADRWINQYQRVRSLIRKKLWDPETGFYYDLDPDGNKIMLKTLSGFTPMFARICSVENAEALVTHLISPDEFWRPFPVASVSADEPSFSNDMWRGPVWINYNYMIIEALNQYGYNDMASDLKQKTINEIARWYGEDGIIYEYYDSEGISSPSMLNRKGHKPTPDDTWPLGRCIRDYHWTAALFIDLLMD